MIRNIVSPFAGCFLLNLTLWAQGIIIPHPRPFPHPDWTPTPLQVQSVRMHTKIQHQVAETRIVQVFFNPNPFPLEGTYMFPLPLGAALKEFAIYEGNQKLKGEVVEKEEARRIYLDILRKWKDPGLLEFVNENLLQARVFPIPAAAEKKIELAYAEVLGKENDFVRYLYPLGKGTNMSAVLPKNVSGLVNIEAAAPLKTIFSPSTRIDIRREGERLARVSFDLDRPQHLEDFLLYFSLSPEEIGVAVVSEKTESETGYFLLAVSPRVEVDTSRVQPKSLIFVIDTSGSMHEPGKLNKAKNALKFGLRGLNTGDTFNIVSFATSERVFRDHSVPASPPNVEGAIRFVDSLEASGGTNIHDALVAAIKSFPALSRHPRYLVFLTDGLPTVGQVDVGEILKAVELQVREQPREAPLRIFPFGVGYDVNTLLLDRLALDNGGYAFRAGPMAPPWFQASGRLA